MIRISIRPEADRDLDAIFDWIARDDPAAAERHVRRLVTEAMALGDFPERGSPRPEIGAGARSMVVGRYLILYRIAGGVVEIIRFVHGARDLDGVFGAAD